MTKPILSNIVRPRFMMERGGGGGGVGSGVGRG